MYGHESWYDNDAISRRFCRFENKTLKRIAIIRGITEVPYVDEVKDEGKMEMIGTCFTWGKGKLGSECCWMGA